MFIDTDLMEFRFNGIQSNFSFQTVKNLQVLKMSSIFIPLIMQKLCTETL